MRKLMLAGLLMGALIGATPTASHAQIALDKGTSPDTGASICKVLLIKMTTTKLSLDQQAAETASILKKPPSSYKQYEGFYRDVQAKLNGKYFTILRQYLDLKEKYTAHKCDRISGLPVEPKPNPGIISKPLGSGK